MLACLIERARVGARDGLAEMLVKTVGRMDNRGKERLEEIHYQRRGKTEEMIEVLGRILEGATELGGGDTALGRHVRELLAEHGGAETLLDGYATVSEHKGGNHLPLLWGFYSGQRATLLKVARSLIFHPTTEDHSPVEALSFVLENAHRRGEWLANTSGLDLSFAGERWRTLIHGESNGHSALNRRHLEVCVFYHLAAELKTGDLCVEGSENRDATHEQIDSLFSATIDRKLIETHWRDLMRVVLSIKEGKILPSMLLKKLGNYSRKNRLYRAFREVGRVIRTAFLLHYLSDLELRRQITAATNKAESYNNFSDWVFFGGEGLLAENYPEEQEKRMKFKELFANSLIAQNTADMSEVYTPWPERVTRSGASIWHSYPRTSPVTSSASAITSWISRPRPRR